MFGVQCNDIDNHYLSSIVKLASQRSVFLILPIVSALNFNPKPIHVFVRGRERCIKMSLDYDAKPTYLFTQRPISLPQHIFNVMDR